MSQLTLIAPDPVGAVPPQAAAGLVPVSAQAQARLDGKVGEFLANLLAHDPHSPDFARATSQIATIGQREVAALAALPNRMLAAPDRGNGAQDAVGAALETLRAMAERLDPAHQGDLLRPRKLLGLIPLGSRLDAYFERFAGAQGQIQAVISSLVRGKDALLQDNIAIETERAHMWELMGKLEEMIAVTRLLDERLEQRAAMLDHGDPGMARAIRENALFPARQRQTDLLTQMAVSVQGYFALDLVRKTNLELIKGVDRATTTTIAALRTAVTVAQALGRQRLVLDQITALNSAAGAAIQATATTLRDQGTVIDAQAASATLQVEALQRAFADIHAAMREVDRFKGQALDNLETTILTLARETEKARSLAR